ncbi:MAG: T9SS type A sorting domain-containing protein [Calditrichae bacterium]|nr:T9SS type A sorting domain-containing protein [Calditrichia bacterium]
MPSAIITATYLIDESIQLPVVSLSTDPQNLWDYETGIYVMGPNADPDFPHHGANFWQDWEKPIHIEFFEKDGSLGFNANAGVKITGGWTRGFPQKSLAIFMRRRYGQSELDYPLFPELDFTTFKSFVLRNSGNDWNATMIRDGLMTGLTRPLGIDHLAHRPVVVFLNGAYWGIHNMREKVNEDFLAAHHNVDPAEIDLLENNAAPLEGSAEHYEMMMDYIVNNNVKYHEVYKNIQNMMNVNNYIDYEVAQIYFDNTDWPGNNIKFWRPQAADGRWRWILYDTDFGFGLFDQNGVAHNTLEFATEPNGPSWPNPPWSTYLLRRLLENDDFKVQFINSIADKLNSNFSQTQVSDRITLLKGNIIIDIPRHLTRWGQQYSEWSRKVTALYAYASQRPPYLRFFVVNKFQLSGTAEIMVRNTNVVAGKVQINSLVVNDSLWNGTYFKDVPIQIKAIPESGYRFAGWSGGINSPHDSLSVILTGSLALTAEFTFDTSMVINEINYNSSPDFPVGDWVEFYNNSRLPIDLSGWIFKDANDLHIFRFPDSFVIDPDSYIVLSNDSIAFTSRFPSVTNLVGFFDYGLSKGGEHIRLFDNDNHIIDSLTYDDILPWPVEADGYGSTLSLTDPGLDNSHPESWEASVIHGTPGKPNLGLTAVELNKNNLIPKQYQLDQNYPNPFNPVTRIPVSVALPGYISLKIYDIRGKHVETIIEENIPAGKYEFAWRPGISLSSGVYFYQVEITGKCRQTKKLLYLK